MKRRMLPYFSALVVIVLIAAFSGPVFAQAQFVIPTISITSVDPGKTVTIQTQNYPANDNFDVYMNYFGTLGIGGTKVATVSSGKGGAQSFTFTIPDTFKNERLVAIRLQSPTSGFFSYNWFINQTASSTPGIPTTGQPGTIPAGTIPTIAIVSVDPGKTVTIKTNNYPANDNFDVLMGNFGTLGVGGTKVTTVNSGAGGAQSFTFTIPAALANNAQIAIRLQSPTTGYFSYNWFNNVTGGSTPGIPTTGQPGTIPAGTVPTISIQSVAKDSSVTIVTKNFPANDSFDVTMNSFGTLGVGGTKVTTVSSGTGGTQTFTISIPAGMQGKDRIAIRLQSPTSGYFSYNWFWNVTYP